VSLAPDILSHTYLEMMLRLPFCVGFVEDRGCTKRIRGKRTLSAPQGGRLSMHKGQMREGQGYASSYPNCHEPFIQSLLN
jgi:hypothetical protein